MIKIAPISKQGFHGIPGREREPQGGKADLLAQGRCEPCEGTQAELPQCSWAGKEMQAEDADLLAERGSKLRKGVLQAELANEGEDRGEARHAHHERKVALDGLAHARVAHLHRHHYACAAIPPL